MLAYFAAMANHTLFLKRGPESLNIFWESHLQEANKTFDHNEIAASALRFVLACMGDAIFDCLAAFDNWRRIKHCR